MYIALWCWSPPGGAEHGSVFVLQNYWTSEVLRFALTTAVWVQPKLLPGPAAPNDQYPLMWASWTRIKHFRNSESSRDTRALC